MALSACSGIEPAKLYPKWKKLPPPAIHWFHRYLPDDGIVNLRIFLNLNDLFIPHKASTF
jgi:hypothetical protein